MPECLRQTWRLSEEGRPLEMMDPSLAECHGEEASLCIQLGLLCCQAAAVDRPDMGSVYLALLSEPSALPRAGRPGVRGRVGRWTATPSSSLSKMTNTSGVPTSSSAGATSRTGAISDGCEWSKNSISISFNSDGR